MDKRFLTAFLVPDRWRVGGYWLAPYCIDHIIKLQALNHPIMRGEVPNPAELVLFLQVCSVRRPNFFELKPHLVDKLFIWKMQKNSDFYGEMLKGVMTYITEYSSVPKVVGDDSERHENNPPVPPLLGLVGILIAKTSLTEQEVLRMPYGKAVWYAISAARAEGADVKTISTTVEENADKDREAALQHAERVKEKLRLAMVNGQMPKRRIN